MVDGSENRKWASQRKRGEEGERERDRDGEREEADGVVSMLMQWTTGRDFDCEINQSRSWGDGSRNGLGEAKPEKPILSCRLDAKSVLVQL